MAKGRTWLTMTARACSVLLMLCAAFALVAAANSFFWPGPASGAVGLGKVDALFGGFVLLIAARFLWIYAVKTERRRELEV